MALPAILAPIAGAIGGTFISILAFSPVAGDLVKQQLYNQFPIRNPTPMDLLRALWRGIITDERFNELMRLEGFAGETVDIIAKGSLDELNTREIILLWFRYRNEPNNPYGINNLWLEERLTANGFDLNRKEEWIEANRAVPSLDDIIRFAVRDVYEPEQARLAGLFEDMPEVFVEEAEKRSLKREDTEKYWASHWFIPSTNQMIEMSQRLFDHPDPDVRFGDEEMLNGFKLADIAPGFRKRLLAISKQPVGRVDIRRFDSMGIYGEGEQRRQRLVRAYMELGYARKDAEQQTEFTIRLNDRREESGSVSEVLRFYREGVFTENARDQAKTMLVERGAPEERAELLLKLEDLKQVTDEERKTIDQIKQEWLSGTIQGEATLRKRLANVPLTSSDINKFLKDFKREKEAGRKRMSRSQADELRRLGIIAPLEWRQIYEAEGFVERDINAIDKTFERAVGADRAAPTKSDLLGWLQAQIITVEEFVRDMRDLGFQNRAIMRYLAQAGQPRTEEELEGIGDNEE